MCVTLGGAGRRPARSSPPVGADGAATAPPEREADIALSLTGLVSALRACIPGRSASSEAEIAAQPESLEAALAGRIVDGVPALEGLGLERDGLRTLERVVLVATGGAHHAALAARHAFEAWARVPCESELASEWLHRDPVLGPRTLVIVVSHGDDAKDALAGVQLARAHGSPTLAVTSTNAGAIAESAHGALDTRSGPAASQSFLAETVLLALLALQIAQARDELTAAAVRSLARELEATPGLVHRLLEDAAGLDPVADRFASATLLLFTGSHVGLSACHAGAAVVRELSCVPVEVCPVGELARGSAALPDGRAPVVAVAGRAPRPPRTSCAASSARAPTAPRRSRSRASATGASGATPTTSSPCPTLTPSSRPCSPSCRCSSWPSVWRAPAARSRPSPSARLARRPPPEPAFPAPARWAHVVLADERR